MSRFVKQGVNPFTKAPIDLLDVNAFARPRPSRRRALTFAGRVADTDRGTRLGGLPYLAVETRWPLDNGEPLVHLAQFDLSALRRVGVGAEALEGPGGVLAIFIPATDPLISAATRVIATFAPDGEAAQLAEPPGEGLVRPAVPLVATAITETEDERRGTALEPRHKFGGFRAGIEPDSLMGAPDFLGAVSRLEALGIDPIALGEASADFELLAQIDSDKRAELCWGDVGRLYLFARESEVRTRSFKNIVAWADSG